LKVKDKEFVWLIENGKFKANAHKKRIFKKEWVLPDVVVFIQMMAG